MLPPFDVLKVGDDGIPIWVTSAATVDEAKARIKELAKRSSAKEFLIFSQQTQNKISVKPHEK